MSINLVSSYFKNFDTNGDQPWSWYVFMIVRKTLNLKQCSTMNQQRQTMFHNEPIETNKKQALTLIAHWTMHKHI
jgi:hypothetical protein